MLLGGLLTLVGCARVNDTGLRLVSSARDAILIVNGQLLRGDVLLIPDRTGRATFALPPPPAANAENPAAAPVPPAPPPALSNCHASMRHTGTNAGAMDLRCNDGSVVPLQFTLITETRGYAYGSASGGVVSLVFGLSDEEALAYLRPPQGKKLVLDPKQGTLVIE